jgi:hypothetical protein
LAKPGKGKSGGYRVIVGLKRGERIFYLWFFQVDFWRKSNKPPFASFQSFLGFHFPSGIIARSATSPDLTKNQPIGP